MQVSIPVVALMEKAVLIVLPSIFPKKALEIPTVVIVAKEQIGVLLGPTAAREPVALNVMASEPGIVP